MSSDWFPKSKPKLPPPQRGIKVDRIGTTWWGQRWIEALERLSRDYLSRMGRGRAYARAGRVHDLIVSPGQVTARVTGSDPEPYEVTLRIAIFDARIWNRVIAAMSGQALYAAELLAGRMPMDIDKVFRAGGQSLFPVKQRDIETDCSCPDWANPCKHVAATHYVLGEAFDKDPFLLFELRGRTRDQVLAALSRLRAREGKPVTAAALPRVAEAAADPGPVSMALAAAGRSPKEFEVPAAPLPHLTFQMAVPAHAAAILRQLGAPPSWPLEQSPVELFAPLYERAGQLARELALRPRDEPSPFTAAAVAATDGSPKRHRKPRGAR